MLQARRYSAFGISEVLRLTMLKSLRDQLKEFIHEAMVVRYVAVPVWRPWRDFLPSVPDPAREGLLPPSFKGPSYPVPKFRSL